MYKKYTVFFWSDDVVYKKYTYFFCSADVVFCILFVYFTMYRYTFCIPSGLFILPTLCLLRVYFEYTKSILHGVIESWWKYTKKYTFGVYFLYKRRYTKSILNFCKDFFIISTDGRVDSWFSSFCVPEPFTSSSG